MNDSNFPKGYEGISNFELRRAVERLREGLFDPLGVQLLTAGEDHLVRVFDQAGKALRKDKPAHLCICGAYGQGKSHSLTYLRERALDQGFVTSQINLDPREVPFHDFQQVYRALVVQIRFPNKETSLLRQWEIWTDPLKDQQTTDNDLLKILPDEIPHLFRCILTALAQDTIPLSTHERQLKKHAAYRPREFPYLLSRALAGEAVPAYRLRHVFKYRQVPFYKDASLLCRGWEPYLSMVYGLAGLFRQMGFKGWVALFDEGESIAQARINSRSKSYEILHRIFFPEHPVFGFYPVFAFTDDFFAQVQEEDYEQVSIRSGIETPYFERNYARKWRNLNICRLNDFSSKEWKALSGKLMTLHATAYQWQPPGTETYENMTRGLSETRGQEARLKLKALVEQLDLVHQEQVLKG